MKSDPWTLYQLLSPPRQFVIPIFQRDYEWTEDEQWQLLFDDLIATASRLGGNPYSPHFLGAIVLEKLPSKKAGSAFIHSNVIDGQQRLATFQLLIRSLLDIATTLKSPKKDNLQDMLWNQDHEINSREDIYKFKPRLRDREIWSQAMSESPSNYDPIHRYLEARQYFRKATKLYLIDKPDPLQAFASLVDACRTMFKIVVIELEGGDDAQVIFEVLNGRQTPLSASDLVKNLIFMRAEREGPNDIDRLYRTYWEPFDANWWKEKVGSGHAARPHTDRMLAAWLTAVSEEPVHDTRKLYGQTRRYLDKSPLEMELNLSEISEYAIHYQVFYAQQPESPRIANAFSKIEELGYITTIPLFLWLRQEKEYGKLKQSEYEQAILDIESYLLRRAITRDSTRGYGSTFWNVLQYARAGAKDSSAVSSAIVREKLCSLRGNATWPSDKALIDAFENIEYYGRVAQYVIKTLLGGIEEQIRVENPQIEKSKIDYRSLSIEHIMPQAWEENWPLKEQGNDLIIAEQNRNAQIHKIGNLTLVSRPLNTLQSNHAWVEKRNALKQFTTLRMNIDLIQYPQWNTWDENTITNRARVLAQYAARAWARPPID